MLNSTLIELVKPFTEKINSNTYSMVKEEERQSSPLNIAGDDGQ